MSGDTNIHILMFLHTDFCTYQDECYQDYTKFSKNVFCV